MISIDVPRNCDDRQTVPSWQQARDAMEEKNRLLEFFSVSVPLFPYAHTVPSIGQHNADQYTVALWQGNPPDNGGSGLVDSSGHGLTLSMGGGNERYGALGWGREGFLLDGTNWWRRPGNDPSLNLTGDMTVELIARPLVQPPGQASPSVVNGAAMVTYAALGETGGNDNVLWAAWAGNAAVSPLPNLAGCWGNAFFWETGAGVNQGVVDYKILPLNQATHVAWVRSGTSLLCYTDGFRQSLTTGITNGTIGGAPTQHVRIGLDQNGTQPFTGLLGSIRVSSVARTAQDIYNSASQCIGLSQREITHMRPILHVTEHCELVEATIVPDDITGTFAPSDTSVTLFRTDESGSTATATVVAKVDGSASSAPVWAPYRPQKMLVPTVRPELSDRHSICISCATKVLNGSLTMKFRRLTS